MREEDRFRNSARSQLYRITVKGSHTTAVVRFFATGTPWWENLKRTCSKVRVANRHLQALVEVHESMGTLVPVVIPQKVHS